MPSPFVQDYSYHHVGFGIYSSYPGIEHPSNRYFDCSFASILSGISHTVHN